MIVFNPDLLTTEHLYLKSCTTALGGSVTIVDTKMSSRNTETFKRIIIPLAIARAFNKKHGVSRYIIPVLCAITKYDGHVVTIERHPSGITTQPTTWISDTETSINNELLPQITVGTWFTDGMFVYSFNSTPEGVINMSADGKFKSVPVNAFKFADLSNVDASLETHPRTCLSFMASDGTQTISPPIWKQLTTVGERQMTEVEDTTEDDNSSNTQIYQFDRIDDLLAVNLGFALKAATELCVLFGYDATEPLALNELMIELRTVNLPKISPHIKRTYDTGMKFTHAVAWLIGLNNKVNTLDSYKILRSLLKYLTTKGVYYKKALSPNAIFKKDMQSVPIPLLTTKTALNVGTVSGSFSNPLLTHTANTNNTVLGHLYGAE